MAQWCEPVEPTWATRLAIHSYTEETVETLQQGHAHSVVTQSNDPAAARAGTLRLAYLLSQYPAVSHTFLLQEVLGLRARGVRIETASINPPDRPLKELPPQELAEHRTTLYIKSGSAWNISLRLLKIAVTRPGVVARGLSTIFRMPGMQVRERGFWLFYLGEALLVGGWMEQRGLRHLHVHFGGAVASVGLLTSAAWQIPYSLTIHGPEELLHPTTHRLRDKLDRASFVLCISDFCRGQLCTLTDQSSWDRFRVIRLGVDPSLLSPTTRSAATATPHPTHPLELLCVGRLVPEKGHAILLQALHLLDQQGIRIQATFVGSGPEHQRLVQYAMQHLPAGAVVFTSALSHPETLKLLRKADLFALISFAEGIPVALMEAMSLGIPCVSTNIAGIPELIRSGRDGLLVSPGDVQATADALASLATGPALRKQLGSSARQRILTDYNLPLNQELLADTLEAFLHADCPPTASIQNSPKSNQRELREVQ